MAIRDFYSRYDTDERRAEARRVMSQPVTDASVSSGLFAILWRRKGILLACLVACLFSGLVYIMIAPPRYMASTAMLIDPRLGKTVGADPVQPGFIVDTGAMDSQIKLFTSQTVLSRVAKMADLADNPEFNGSQRSLLQILSPSQHVARRRCRSEGLGRGHHDQAS